jgi:hypothetical protein
MSGGASIDHGEGERRGERRRVSEREKGHVMCLGRASLDKNRARERG